MRIKSVNTMTHKLKLSMSAAAILALSGCGGSNTNTDIKAVDTSTPVSDWVMVWNDEFEGTSIDTNKWSHEVNCDGGGNQEQQCYTDSAENSFVSDGMLNIVAKPSTDGEDLPYTSARMITKNKGDWTYGRFEMRAKLPFGQGTWPAFWMLSTDEVYGSWPRSGEIDILEAVNLKEVNADGEVENSTVGQLYYGSGTPNQNLQFDSSGTTYDLPDGQNPADEFHTYAVEWQEGEIRWYVDGYLFQTQRQSNLIFNSKGEVTGLFNRGWYAEFFDLVTGELEDDWSSAPFDQDFFILLNLAVGGAFPANTNNAANFPDTNGIDPAALANGQTFQIDYVRVFQCSVNPSTGKGCETVRANYNVEASDEVPDGALVEGVAPTPPPPPGGPIIPITIFADAENPGWPLWDSSENTVPAVIQDDAEHGAVASFSVVNNDGAVLGFNSRIADNSVPYNAQAMAATGKFSFEMKVVSAPPAGGPWLLKLESDGNSSDSGEIPLTQSEEGLAPVVGEWQTYTFSVGSFQAGGLDLGLIDLIMIFPTWGTGEGAEYLIDNVKFAADGGGSNSPELVLFENSVLAGWPLWDCCAGSTPTIETDDAEHGEVVEFSVLGNAETVQGFNGRNGDSTFDASALAGEGVVQFEMKIVTAPSVGTPPWIFKLEANGGSNTDATKTTFDVNLNSSIEGVEPVVGEWQTYTFNLAPFAAAGFDLSAIDVMMVFPTWGAGGGAVYRVDNAKIFNPNATGGGTPTLEGFIDAVNPDWPLWDCCAGSTPTVEADDAERGNVVEFSVLGNAETVQGFNARLAATPTSFDASALAGVGVVRFDMKIVTAPSVGTPPWLFKLEANGGSNTDATKTTFDVNLNSSIEGVEPVVGVWQTYTFNLGPFAAAGFDLSAIDVIMIFPSWGAGGGAVYRVDNVVITAP